MNMKKQFYRIKQQALQNFSIAGKSEVLSDDLVIAEKRIEDIRKVCHSIRKLIPPFKEKQNKKEPKDPVLQFFENAGGADEVDDILRQVLIQSSQMHVKLADINSDTDNRIKNNVLQPLQEIMEFDLPKIVKLKNELKGHVLDMDSARSRLGGAEKHSSSSNSTGNVTKIDAIREEVEEKEIRVDQARDALASEMYAVISKEAVLANVLLEYIQLQQESHLSAVKVLEQYLPDVKSSIDNGHLKPVFKTSLDEHLRSTGRKIAYPLELCVCVLSELGMEEEGLFRIAGGAGKVRRLKTGLDAKFMNLETALELRDCHVFADVLKKYFRELPEPLLTFRLYEEWLSAIKHSADENEKLSALRTVLTKLPQTHYDNLRYLIKFLAKLSKNHEINKMTPQNIGIVIAPSLIWSNNTNLGNIGENMSFSNQHTAIVECLVRNADWFFPGEEKFYVTFDEVQSTTKVREHTRSNSADLRSFNVELSSPTEPSIERCQSTTSLEEQIQTQPLAESPKPMNRTRKNKPAPIPPISNNAFGSPFGTQKDKSNVTNKTGSTTSSYKSHLPNEISPTNVNMATHHQESFSFKELSDKLNDVVEHDDKEEKSRSRSPRSKVGLLEDNNSNVSTDVRNLLTAESLNKILESKKVTKPVPAPRISLEKFNNDEVTPRKPLIPEKPTGLTRPMSCTFKSFKLSDLPDVNKSEAEKGKGPSLEKAHLYSVDKQQVSFIEIASSPDDSSPTDTSVSTNHEYSTLRSRSSFSSSDNRGGYEKSDNTKSDHRTDSGQNSSHMRALSDGHNIDVSNTANLPPHRNYQRIQRPIPPPPPPPVSSKSQIRSGSISDSTNL
ncbi:rho GTPase-activating protein 17-like isoform X2 [Planococcus citri]|uniref:rho GTPase-activating protein 17-like isoform X2 n=1 Tax=Planococcus citri TaxID=170843 RepID=UPI0031F817D0